MGQETRAATVRDTVNPDHHLIIVLCRNETQAEPTLTSVKKRPSFRFVACHLLCVPRQHFPRCLNNTGCLQTPVGHDRTFQGINTSAYQRVRQNASPGRSERDRRGLLKLIIQS